MGGQNLLSLTLKDLHLERSQLLKRPTHLTALFDGCRLSSLPPYFSRLYQHLQPVGVGPLQGRWQEQQFGLQALARGEPPPTSAGDGGWLMLVAAA